MNMWEFYERELGAAEKAWTEAELPGGPGGGAPPVVAAVAKVTGLSPEELWNEVEGNHGWEPHDTGYEYAVWFTAWGMKGYPDWQAAPGSIDGNQQVPS